MPAQLYKRADTSPDFAGFLDAVGRYLDEFVQRNLLWTQDDDDHPVFLQDSLHGFLTTGGKRLRAALCRCGWLAATDEPEPASLAPLAAAVELFHAFTLIHDDVMDGSTMRRGRLCLHQELTATFQNGRSEAAARALGAHSAVLLGDLVFGWSHALFATATNDEAHRESVLKFVNLMQMEAVAGQLLDLEATGGLTTDLASAWRILRYKTSKYTVERPLHIGAALAGADAAVVAACTDFALPAGDAFQLRDDLLGVFGNPSETGKSAVEDLRSGKHTVLLATALRNANARQRRRIQTLVGNPDLDDAGAAEARELLISTGAVRTVEDLIFERSRQALEVLRRNAIRHRAAEALRELVQTVTTRTS